MTETLEMALPLRPTHEFYHFSTPTFVQRRRRGVRASLTPSIANEGPTAVSTNFTNLGA